MDVMNQASRTAAPRLNDDELARLIAGRRPGFSLDREFYANPEIYRRELEEFLLRRWLCVGHASRIPKIGDYFLFEIDSESLILVRGKHGKVAALAKWDRKLRAILTGEKAEVVEFTR